MTESDIYGRLSKARSFGEKEMRVREEVREDFLPPPYQAIEEELGPLFEEAAKERIAQKEANQMQVGDREKEVERVKALEIEAFASQVDKMVADLQEGLVICLERLPNFCSDKEYAEIISDIFQKVAELLEKDSFGEGNRRSIGFSSQTLQAIYRCAHQLFSDERWNEAIKVLRLLVFLDLSIGEAWLLMGMSEQRKGDLELALGNYLMAVELLPGKPEPLYWAAVAAVMLNQKESASGLCELLNKRIEGFSENAEKEKWKLKVKALNREIKVIK